MKKLHEKKIITIQAIQLLWERNPDSSLYQISKLIYSTARSKNIKLGFSCKNFKSFYDSVLKFSKNSVSPLLINPNILNELEQSEV
jgi:hypothetical protein